MTNDEWWAVAVFVLIVIVIAAYYWYSKHGASAFSVGCPMSCQDAKNNEALAQAEALMFLQASPENRVMQGLQREFDRTSREIALETVLGGANDGMCPNTRLKLSTMSGPQQSQLSSSAEDNMALGTTTRSKKHLDAAKFHHRGHVTNGGAHASRMASAKSNFEN